MWVLHLFGVARPRGISDEQSWRAIATRHIFNTALTVGSKCRELFRLGAGCLLCSVGSHPNISNTRLFKAHCVRPVTATISTPASALQPMPSNCSPRDFKDLSSL